MAWIQFKHLIYRSMELAFLLGWNQWRHAVSNRYKCGIFIVPFLCIGELWKNSQVDQDLFFKLPKRTGLSRLEAQFMPTSIYKKCKSIVNPFKRKWLIFTCWISERETVYCYEFRTRVCSCLHQKAECKWFFFSLCQARNFLNSRRNATKVTGNWFLPGSEQCEFRITLTVSCLEYWSLLFKEPSEKDSLPSAQLSLQCFLARKKYL